MVPRENNFDLLRAVFAFTVFLVHAHALSEQPALAFLSHWLSSKFAVEAFFVVSGYLVVMSFCSSASAADYFAKRARRIYPAYFAIVVGWAFGGALLTQLPLTAYFNVDWLKYVSANLSFLNFLGHDLPGVFEGNPFTAVNGALWTLKIEVAFYLCVPVIVYLASRFGPAPVLAILYLLSVAYAGVMGHLAQGAEGNIYLLLQRQLPGQLAYFVAGGAGYYYFDVLRRHWLRVVPFALVVFFLPLASELELVLRPAALGALVLFAALGLRYLGNFGRYGDMSYGIYIVHFPIVQTLVSYGIFQSDPFLALGIASLLVLVSAFLSWHLIEKPFLRRTSHYVLATETATGK